MNMVVRSFAGAPMRSIHLRNKILFVSLKNSDELKYSPDVVRKLFARTVQTGFRDQVLR